jgi:hypothetical protein
VKYEYLLNGYEAYPVLRGKQISRREFCDCCSCGDTDDLRWEYYVLGNMVSEKKLSKARKRSRRGLSSEIFALDTVKKIIF